MRHVLAPTITVVYLDIMITMVCATRAHKMRHAPADTNIFIVILGGIKKEPVVCLAMVTCVTAKL